jgi:hypothetical protein
MLSSVLTIISSNCRQKYQFRLALTARACLFGKVDYSFVEEVMFGRKLRLDPYLSATLPSL